MATPTGFVRLFIDNTSPANQIALLNLDGGGQASSPYTVPISTTPGDHVIICQYSGDNNFPPANGQCNLTVTQGQQNATVTVTVNPASVAQGGATTISVTVSGS